MEFASAPAPTLVEPLPPIPTVVKLGGSLLDLPGLAERLGAQLAQTPWPLLVVGGGEPADWLRRLDALHGLGQESSHWLALRAATFNAHVVAALLPGAVVVPEPTAGSACWSAGRVPVLDVLAFLLAEEGRRDLTPLPHRWEATTDAVAARVARRCQPTARLLLLKSTDGPAGPDGQLNLAKAAQLGIIDPLLPAEAAELPSVRLLNLRR